MVKANYFSVLLFLVIIPILYNIFQIFLDSYFRFISIFWKNIVLIKLTIISIIYSFRNILVFGYLLVSHTCVCEKREAPTHNHAVSLLVFRGMIKVFFINMYIITNTSPCYFVNYTNKTYQ